MIKTWQERCEIHPDHQTGMITYQMIQNRMQEEIDDLRDALEKTLTDEEYKNIFANGKRLGVLETENRIWAGMNSMAEEIGLLTTDPRFSHIESPLLLEFARAILRKAQEK